MDQSRFGLLTVLSVDEADRKYRLCSCDCGTQKRVRIDHLRLGKTLSCGCEHARRSSARAGNMHRANITHGKTKSRAYSIWCSMRQRCNNENFKYFPYYGGRGIKVHDEWNASFEAFLRDMGEPPMGYEIDRIDNNGHYEPGNCRWATRAEQQNNRRVNRFITHNGETLTIAEWSRRTGISRNTIDQRLAANWSIDRVLAPVKQTTVNNVPVAVEAARLARLARTHCKHGHPWDDQNTSFTPTGGRICKACRRAKEARRRNRRKETI